MLDFVRRNLLRRSGAWKARNAAEITRRSGLASLCGSWTQKWPVCSTNMVASSVWAVMSQCHADLRGLGGKCVCVVPGH